MATCGRGEDLGDSGSGEEGHINLGMKTLGRKTVGACTWAVTGDGWDVTSDRKDSPRVPNGTLGSRSRQG